MFHKKKSLYFKFKKNIFKYLNKKNLIGKKYMINYSLLKTKTKIMLNIKRILTYGKLFLKIPDKILKYKFNLNKASTIISNINLFRTFLLPISKKNIIKKIITFNYKFFFLISLLIKFNFGVLFTNLGKAKKKNYNHIDNFFYNNIKYYLFKYLDFLSNYAKNLNNKTSFFNKKKNFYFKILFSLVNQISLNSYLKKINLLFKNKLKYLNYCYRGNKFKLLKKTP
jgi:hypothetical protein